MNLEEKLKNVEEIKEKVKNLRDKYKDMVDEANNILNKSSKLNKEIESIWEPLHIEALMNNDLLWTPRLKFGEIHLHADPSRNKTEELLNKIHQIHQNGWNHFSIEFEDWGISINDSDIAISFNPNSSDMIKDLGLNVDLSELKRSIKESKEELMIAEKTYAEIKHLVKIEESKNSETVCNRCGGIHNNSCPDPR